MISVVTGSAPLVFPARFGAALRLAGRGARRAGVAMHRRYTEGSGGDKAPIADHRDRQVPVRTIEGGAPTATWFCRKTSGSVSIPCSQRYDDVSPSSQGSTHEIREAGEIRHSPEPTCASVAPPLEPSAGPTLDTPLGRRGSGRSTV